MSDPIVPPRRARIIGPGRAGRSVAGALAAVGWTVLKPVGSSAKPATVAKAAHGVDLVVIATPDAAIGEVAAAVAPDTSGSAVVMHLAGSIGLDVLLNAGHPRVAAMHPLVSMPNPEVGAAGLRAGTNFAVAGDPIVHEIVVAWGGRWFEVADDDRALYHAAACIASNHLVALLGQVERVAAAAGVPLDAYLELARTCLDNVEVLGPSAALTGPAARGDWPTIGRHIAALDAIAPGDRAAYEAMVAMARRLVES